MEELNGLIKVFAEQHKNDITKAFKYTVNTRLLTDAAPEVIRNKLNLNANDYKIYASVGNGNWSEIPWLAILDRDITESTREGYYLVFLFTKDLSAVSLSLGLGWTQFKKEFSTKQAKNKIRSYSNYFSKLLNKDDFIQGEADLGASNTLGIGYQLGSIVHKTYELDNIERYDIIADTRELLNKYKNLKSIVGNHIFNLPVDDILYDQEIKDFAQKVAHETFNNEIEAAFDNLVEEARLGAPESRERKMKYIVRNRKFANYVKERANFICEICGREPFFKENGEPYAEADHINPLGGNSGGKDHPDNMRCICPQCHAIVTYGSKEEIRKLINTE